MIEETPAKSPSTPRTREASPPFLLDNRQDTNTQRKEDVGVRGEDSDSPIVVSDGSAEHMAKGRAGGQCSQSTHARKRTASMLRVKHPDCPDPEGGTRQSVTGHFKPRHLRSNQNQPVCLLKGMFFGVKKQACFRKNRR